LKQQARHREKRRRATVAIKKLATEGEVTQVRAEEELHGTRK
jgi:hypothetical protein